MAYTGNIPAEQYISTVKDTFNGDNSTTDFTLSRPSLANNLEVFVENVQQEPTTAYTVSGTTISFTSAPPTGTGNIYVIHRGQAVQTVVPPAGISVNATDLTVTGASALQDGLTVDNDGATVATFDRATSDGTIVDLQKDGTTVGSIGVGAGNELYIGTADTGLFFNASDEQILPYNPNSVTFRDAGIDLGQPSYRFKNLYLSGGVYLGGTGAANYLDDYEEGTWTPVLYDAVSGGNASPSSTYAEGKYTKIGRVVFLRMWYLNISLSGMTGGNIAYLGGLPFPAASGIGGFQGNIRVDRVTATGQIGFNLDQNVSRLSFTASPTDGNSSTNITVGNLDTGQSDIRSTVIYFTDA